MIRRSGTRASRSAAAVALIMLYLLFTPSAGAAALCKRWSEGEKAGALDRLEEVLDAHPDVPPSADEPEVVQPPLAGTLEIRNLSFAYTPGGPPALHDVSLTVPEGSRIALVGPVGSGKSTLANLLVRAYPVPHGTIFVGGVDVNDLSVTRLRKTLGYVPQEAFLFSKPLRDNIALGRPDAGEEEIARAVEARRMPDAGALKRLGIDKSSFQRIYFR